MVRTKTCLFQSAKHVSIFTLKECKNRKKYYFIAHPVYYVLVTFITNYIICFKL